MTDALVLLLVGAMAAAWFFTVLGAAYAGYRYVYRPWKVMRQDLKTMADELQVMKAEIGLRKAVALSDEEQATLERRARARQLWAAPSAPSVQVPR